MPDERLFQQLDFKRLPADEEAADIKALDLLKNSPDKEAPPSAALFLWALSEHAPQLPNLIRAHLGNSFAGELNPHMEALRATPPQLDERRMGQIAALPFGGRIRLDPWSDNVENAQSAAAHSDPGAGKMPFEIAPLFLT